MLNPEHRRAVAQAVAAAEARTSGEIVCILSQEVSKYREVPLGWAVATALLLPPVLGAFGLDLTGWAVARGWSSGHGAGAGAGVAQALQAYALIQVVLFAVVAGLVAIPAVRRVLTPGVLKSHRVHKTAFEQFLATGMHANPERTGVVIFASFHDRRVEILADEAIHQAVGEAVWKDAVAAVEAGMKRGDPAAGFVRAVELCGEALARSFPAGDGPKRNALPDDLLEI